MLNKRTPYTDSILKIGSYSVPSKRTVYKNKIPLDSTKVKYRTEFYKQKLADDTIATYFKIQKTDPTTYRYSKDPIFNTDELTENIVDDSSDPFDAAAQQNLRENTTKVLSSLSPREERVLRMRFGIGVDKEHSLGEIAQAFSVTNCRIMQIEAKALRKLKHPTRTKFLKDFLKDAA